MFTFLGFAGAVNARLKQAMIQSEVWQEAAIMNSVLAAGDTAVLHVGTAPGRVCATLAGTRR